MYDIGDIITTHENMGIIIDKIGTEYLVMTSEGKEISMGAEAALVVSATQLSILLLDNLTKRVLGK